MEKFCWLVSHIDGVLEGQPPFSYEPFTRGGLSEGNTPGSVVTVMTWARESSKSTVSGDAELVR
jgi:hypothetical protein